MHNAGSASPLNSPLFPQNSSSVQRALTPSPSWERGTATPPPLVVNDEDEEENPRSPAVIIVAGKGDLESAR